MPSTKKKSQKSQSKVKSSETVGEPLPKKIYWPASLRVITPGHIQCLVHLACEGDIVVGLLTKEAMEGYKKEVVSYEDRRYIAKTIAIAIGYSMKRNIWVVPQTSLDPSENIKEYGCTHIASGDGWEKEEAEAISKLGIGTIDIKLTGETKKMYSSSVILNE